MADQQSAYAKLLQLQQEVQHQIALMEQREREGQVSAAFTALHPLHQPPQMYDSLPRTSPSPQMFASLPSTNTHPGISNQHGRFHDAPPVVAALYQPQVTASLPFDYTQGRHQPIIPGSTSTVNHFNELGLPWRSQQSSVAYYRPKLDRNLEIGRQLHRLGFNRERKAKAHDVDCSQFVALCPADLVCTRARKQEVIKLQKEVVNGHCNNRHLDSEQIFPLVDKLRVEFLLPHAGEILAEQYVKNWIKALENIEGWIPNAQLKPSWIKGRDQTFNQLRKIGTCLTTCRQNPSDHYLGVSIAMYALQNTHCTMDDREYLGDALCRIHALEIDINCTLHDGQTRKANFQSFPKKLVSHKFEELKQRLIAYAGIKIVGLVYRVNSEKTPLNENNKDLSWPQLSTTGPSTAYPPLDSGQKPSFVDTWLQKMGHNGRTQAPSSGMYTGAVGVFGTRAQEEEAAMVAVNGSISGGGSSLLMFIPHQAPHDSSSRVSLAGHSSNHLDVDVEVSFDSSQRNGASGITGAADGLPTDDHKQDNDEDLSDNEQLCASNRSNNAASTPPPANNPVDCNPNAATPEGYPPSPALRDDVINLPNGITNAASITPANDHGNCARDVALPQPAESTLTASEDDPPSSGAATTGTITNNNFDKLVDQLATTTTPAINLPAATVMNSEFHDDDVAAAYDNNDDHGHPSSTNTCYEAMMTGNHLVCSRAFWCNTEGQPSRKNVFWKMAAKVEHQICDPCYQKHGVLCRHNELGDPSFFASFTSIQEWMSQGRKKKCSACGKDSVMGARQPLYYCVSCSLYRVCSDCWRSNDPRRLTLISADKQCGKSRAGRKRKLTDKGSHMQNTPPSRGDHVLSHMLATP